MCETDQQHVSNESHGSMTVCVCGNERPCERIPNTSLRQMAGAAENEPLSRRAEAAEAAGPFSVTMMRSVPLRCVTQSLPPIVRAREAGGTARDTTR
eukprot:406926-Heterocapsa_arctica.AAC.1